MKNNFTCLVKSEPFKQEVNHTVILPSLAAVEWNNEQQFNLSAQIRTSQTGQPYSDTSPLWWVFSGWCRKKQQILGNHIFFETESFLRPSPFPAFESLKSFFLHSGPFINQLVKERAQREEKGSTLSIKSFAADTAAAAEEEMTKRGKFKNVFL